MQFTADQIASMVNGEVVGDGNVAISSFAKIEEGKPGAISFLANPKYAHFIYNTESSIVLVRRDFAPEHPINATLIKVDDPYATVAQLLELAAQFLTPQPHGVEQPSFVAPDVKLPDDVYIGAFAYIAKGAKIGKGAKIYPHCYVGENASVGEDTTLYSGVKVYHRCSIGNRCIIHSGAVIGADGFGFAPVGETYKKIPQLGIVEIADDVEIGANTAIDRSTMGATHIEQGVKLDNLIQIAHNCVVGSNTVIASQTGIAGSTKLGKHCVIGGQVGFAGHIQVGNNVTIGAQSGIPGNVPDNKTLMGYPAIDARHWQRQQVYIKHLAELFARVDTLEKAK
ncbi:MAG: UDP-3-O-(3-hydroxymyristoyl)glucosamine N-acyltransferase [Muribaculaceae bacterium]|nr:UDP-3-O-(3-hydroxymyristoyl)glucosamine N-acyltransferase [Muribaculaceae bacterium]